MTSGPCATRSRRVDHGQRGVPEAREVDRDLELERGDHAEHHYRQEICDPGGLDIGARPLRALIGRETGGELRASHGDQAAIGLADLRDAPARVHQMGEPQSAAGVDDRVTRLCGRDEQAHAALHAAELGAAAGELRDEAAEHVVHHGDDEAISIGEVNVERAARQLRARADRIEARVEPMLGELLDAGGDQRGVGRLLGLGARATGGGRTSIHLH